MRISLLFLGSLTLLLATASDLPPNASDFPLSQLHSLAATALSAGRSASALEIYDHILTRSPDDFATLYKRATVRLATGALSKAKDAFHEVLKLKPFDQAHLQLARIHAKLGELDSAKLEVDVFLKMGTNSADKVALELNEQIVAGRKSLQLARAGAASGNLELCVSSCTDALTLSPNSEELRLIRAECQLALREWDSTVGDLSRAAALSPALPAHLLIRLSLISGLFLDNGLEIPVDSLSSLKRCLSSDPESKVCRVAFKALKAIEKDLAKLRNWVEAGRWAEATIVLRGSGGVGGLIDTVEALIGGYQDGTATAPLPTMAKLDSHSPLVTILYSTLCRAYVTLNVSKKMEVACANILARDGEDIWGLVGKGEKLMAEEDWEEAVRVFNDAFEKTGKNDRDILGRLQKAQRLLKQSTAKDYYKVLGVSRDADSRTIKRAFRKATLKAHPDKGGSEKAMQAVNEAYEILSKPELKERFDNGEDPNDQSQQQQNPFAQGGFNNFFQQGQGGQQFFQQGGFKVKFG